MIRKYQKQDLDDLLAVWVAASEVAHPFLTREFIVLERENIPNAYLPNAETWVFEEDERVVGFVALLDILRFILRFILRLGYLSLGSGVLRPGRPAPSAGR